MSVESVTQVMRQYFDSHHTDVSNMAPDAVFTIMATGQEHKGPEAIMQMLNYFYRIAFDADADTTVALFSDEHAMVEGIFHGKHIGEFAGIPATGKDVRVPVCIVYDIKDDKITRGRVYFEMPVLMAQLGV